MNNLTMNNHFHLLYPCGDLRRGPHGILPNEMFDLDILRVGNNGAPSRRNTRPLVKRFYLRTHHLLLNRTPRCLVHLQIKYKS